MFVVLLNSDCESLVAFMIVECVLFVSHNVVCCLVDSSLQTK